MDSFAPHEHWSPYYKVSVTQAGGAHPALYVTASNIPYQAARSLKVLHDQKKFYFYPYQHVTTSSLKDELIIGAGSGNDDQLVLQRRRGDVLVRVEVELLLVVQHLQRPGRLIGDVAGGHVQRRVGAAGLRHGHLVVRRPVL